MRRLPPRSLPPKQVASDGHHQLARQGIRRRAGPPSREWRLGFPDAPARPRWAAGAEIQIRQSDIVEMAAAETPMVRDAGAAALEADMAREREALPSVQDLIAGARKDGTVVNPKPEEFSADG
jgi:hypothetical protein